MVKYDDVPKCDDGSPDMQSDEWNLFCGDAFWGMFDDFDVQLIICESCGQPIEDLICPHCHFVHKFSGEIPY